MNGISFVKQPYYLEIREYFYNKIISGEYKAGDKLPSEDDIAKMFGVSRATVNKGLSELLNKDYLRREHGRGTYVAKLRREGNKADIMGFYDSVATKGFSVESDVLASEIITPSKEICDLMDIPITQRVMYLKRLRYVNKDPIVLQENYLSSPFIEELQQIDFSCNSLYRLLKDKFSCEIVHAIDLVDPILAGDEEQELLRIKLNTPILKVTRRSFDIDGNLVEAAFSKYHPAQYQLEIEYALQ